MKPRSGFRRPSWLPPALVSFALAAPLYCQTPDSFNPSAGGPVYALAVQTAGEVLLGGAFPTLGTQTRFFIGRVTGDGALDAFNPGTGGLSPYVYCLAVQTDGGILAGGAFTSLASQNLSRIGRLNSDGTPDTTFNPGADGTVYCLAVRPDGKILVGGSFLTLANQPRAYIGRLNASGTIDTTFHPPASPNATALLPGIFSFALQADGKVVVGGSFTNLCGHPRMNLGRLNTDGTLDTSFNPGANNAVYSVAAQADGKILVGGFFTSLCGQPRNCVGRLNPDGTLDTSFNSSASGDVYSLVLQADGKILVGGAFTNLCGQPRNRIGRLNADGSLDTTFTVGTDNDVYSLSVQPDGRILAGGYFATLGSQPRSCLGRLTNSYAASQTLTSDGLSVTWRRGGATPEIWSTSFEISTNSIDWASLGTGTRIVGGWTLTGISVPTNSTVRARGFVSGGYQNGSSWFVESMLRFVPPPLILTDASFGFNSSNRFGFNISGTGRVVVEGSTDLLNWTALATNKISSTSFYFSDPASTNSPRRLYRARWQ